RAILYDSGVVCWFNFFSEEAYGALWGLMEAVTGWNITPEEWFNVMARRILQIQRATLLLGGPDLRWDPRIHDDVPQRWYEPLTKGPYSGKAVDKARMRENISEYYRAVGWDERGIPTSEELKRLGLDDVDKKLDEIRQTLH
ncbi:MAG: aldehyde ferredoxin oxidoreductase C-terminal domain-containing protein, partial [Candidatus Bathyarchaeia archaeon]